MRKSLSSPITGITHDLSAPVCPGFNMFQYSMLFSLSPVLSPPLRRLNVLDCISAYLLCDHQTLTCVYRMDPYPLNPGLCPPTLLY